MSREMEILSDIADQNDLHVSGKERRSNFSGNFYRATRRGSIFGAMRSAQIKRKPKITLASSAREGEGE